ncbi:hypothetical protein G6F24_018922 [Rhizopus arrhizus]|nr:hypothetical protein G6F24_018922 [Rhizopus arrhizus]
MLASTALASTAPASDAPGSTGFPACTGAAASVDVGSPAATQACQPPSSTATRSWPSQRSIHHRCAPYMPPLAS